MTDPNLIARCLEDDAEWLRRWAALCRREIGGSAKADRLEAIAGRIRELREALQGLVQAVEKDAHENNSISGYTGARLADARTALSKESGK